MRLVNRIHSLQTVSSYCSLGMLLLVVIGNQDFEDRYLEAKVVEVIMR